MISQIDLLHKGCHAVGIEFPVEDKGDSYVD